MKDAEDLFDSTNYNESVEKISIAFERGKRKKLASLPFRSPRHSAIIGGIGPSTLRNSFNYGYREDLGDISMLERNIS